MTEEKILTDLETLLYKPQHNEATRFSKPKWFYNDNKQVSNETVNLLFALHQKLDKKGRAYLISILTSKLRVLSGKARPLALTYLEGHQDFVLVFLVRIGAVNDALEYFRSISYVGQGLINSYFALSEVLDNEPGIFDKDMLDIIIEATREKVRFVENAESYIESDRRKRIASRLDLPATTLLDFDPKRIEDYKESDPTLFKLVRDFKGSLTDKIYQIRHERLSKEYLEGVNFEINQDESKLREIIAEFNFDSELNEVLVKINRDLETATDKFDFKSNIALTRSFIEKLCVSIASEMHKRTGITPSQATTKMGSARNYLESKEIKFLNPEEGKLLETIYGFLSNEGGHALSSKQEHARIAKNIAIEMGLFMLKKLQN